MVGVVRWFRALLTGAGWSGHPIKIEFDYWTSAPAIWWTNAAILQIINAHSLCVLMYLSWGVPQSPTQCTCYSAYLTSTTVLNHYEKICHFLEKWAPQNKQGYRAQNCFKESFSGDPDDDSLKQFCALHPCLFCDAHFWTKLWVWSRVISGQVENVRRTLMIKLKTRGARCVSQHQRCIHGEE